MSTTARRLFLASLALGAFASGSDAQFVTRTIPSAQQRNPVNPYWLVAPGLTQTQYLAQVRAYARTAARIPPWLYGYNPYPSPIISTGPVFPGSGFGFGPTAPTPINPWVGGINPYTSVAAGGGSEFSNPYSPIGPYGSNFYGSGSSWWPNYFDPWGGVLQGSADVIRAYGSAITSQEQARIMREQAYQSQLDTIRKKFDLDMYIKAHTPTFTEEQARIAAITLKRIQNHATAGEVSSGRSLNILVDDLRKFPGKKASADMPNLPDDVLLSLNVANPSSSGSLGILRSGKLPAWPASLQEIFTPAQQKAIEDQLLGLARAAESKGTVDPNALKELRKSLDNAREELGKRINDVSTSEYLNGKRFLNDLDLARIALQNGDGKAQADYLRWAKEAPRSAQDLADYLTRTGLKIAPSTSAEEAAYRAAHSALAALNVQVNAQFAQAPDFKE